MDKNYASLQQSRRSDRNLQGTKCFHGGENKRTFSNVRRSWTIHHKINLYIWEMSIHTVLSVVGNSIFATPETLARMPYLKACLRETLRLYPVYILSAIPQRPKEDIIVGGLLYPWGHCSSLVPCSPNGARWEYFLRCRSVQTGDTTLIELAEAFASLPFGFGTRMFLGGRIAELELHLLMVRIVQQFDISCLPEAESVEPFMRGVFNYDNESSFYVAQFTLHCNAVMSWKWDKLWWQLV